MAMTLASRLFKKNRFHCSKETSPTHHQLVQFMQAAGLRHTTWAWRAAFTDRNLNFAPDACECLEFKHYLAKMLQLYCPMVTPETFVFDEFSWPSTLSDIAELHYTYRGKVQDHVDGLAWILKPALLNNGQRIKIFDRLSGIEEHFLLPQHLGGPHVLQRYILDPDLYDGRKYSMRFFVVITQEEGAFLYPHGYLNVALNPYTGTDFTKLSAHLTNEHLEGHTSSVVQIPTTEVAAYATWYPQIQSITKAVTDGLERAFPHAYHPKKERTFAIFGFDFMLDCQQRAWLLEVNHGPCFPTKHTHPIQNAVYGPFWQALVAQFVTPIATHQPFPKESGVLFQSLRCF